MSAVAQRLKLFFTLIDSRFEDLDRANWKKIVYRDFSHLSSEYSASLGAPLGRRIDAVQRR